jgi:hypothetical protein
MYDTVILFLFGYLSGAYCDLDMPIIRPTFHVPEAMNKMVIISSEASSFSRPDEGMTLPVFSD